MPPLAWRAERKCEGRRKKRLIVGADVGVDVGADDGDCDGDGDDGGCGDDCGDDDGRGGDGGCCYCCCCDIDSFPLHHVVFQETARKISSLPHRELHG